LISISHIVGVVLLLFCRVSSSKADDWKWSRQMEVTRCFKASNLSFQCQDYSEVAKDRTLLTVQELEIEAVDAYGIKRLYSYGKAIEGPLCKEHQSKIKKLLWQVDQVCVTASDEFPSLGKHVFYRWQALETKRGKISW
jgi:hypothetical protein